MNKIITGILIFFSVSVIGVRIYKGIILKQNVTGYLKRAGDANTIALAEEELSKALDYIEKNNLTSGYTSILYQTPDEDLGFWYRNLKASQQELQNLKSESALERTNVLMKLRETLLDTGKKTNVTYPRGLAVFPQNKIWTLLLFLAITALIYLFFMTMVLMENKSKEQQK